jgi:hypothetical protein
MLNKYSPGFYRAAAHRFLLYIGGFSAPPLKNILGQCSITCVIQLPEKYARIEFVLQGYC